MDNPPTSRKPTKDSKRPCHRCHGTGLTQCTICNGTGRVVQGNDAQGHPKFGNCTGCFGRKTARCRSCGGARVI